MRGRPPKPVAELVAAGTFRPHRHADRVDIVGSSDPPVMPDGLPPEAQLVWQENLGRVMQAGVNELDSDLFATYCLLIAEIRAAASRGEAPPAATVSNQIRLANALRLGGPQSRVAVRSAFDVKPKNAFAALRRPGD